MKCNNKTCNPVTYSTFYKVHNEVNIEYCDMSQCVKQSFDPEKAGKSKLSG